MKQASGVILILVLTACTLAAAMILVAGCRASTSIRPVSGVANTPSPRTMSECLEIPVSPTYNPTAMATSPDGEKIVYVSEEQGPLLLWLHSLVAGEARRLQ